MKTEKNILFAFILNISFSIFEFIGGIFTNSVSIMSDSIHDMGDALSIGVSFFLEKKSKKKPDDNYTYGYARYSVLGGLITTVILLVGSAFVIYNAVERIINPVEVDYRGMIVFAIVGFFMNLIATYLTREGDSINQKSVNLHMLEDVLGWLVVLVGAIIMNFTDIKIIDPIMSIGVAIFILVSTLKNLKQILDLFLEKTPHDINVEELKEHLQKVNGVDDIHHIHVWSIDGYNNYATMHIVTKSKNIKKIKQEIREELEEHGICHSILETEDEACSDTNCNPQLHVDAGHHHHHH